MINEFDPRDFFSSLYETSKAVLLSPGDFFEGMKRVGGFLNPFLYLLSCTLFHVLLFGLLKKDPLFILRATILGLVFPLITAGILFLIITRGFKGGGSYETAFRVNAYVSAVSLVSWLPMIGPILEFYRVYLIGVGLSSAFSIRLWKALLAILITMAVYVVAAGAIGGLTWGIDQPWV